MRRMPIFFLKNQTNVYLPFVNIKILQALDRSEVKFIEKGIVNFFLIKKNNTNTHIFFLVITS